MTYCNSSLSVKSPPMLHEISNVKSSCKSKTILWHSTAVHLDSSFNLFLLMLSQPMPCYLVAMPAFLPQVAHAATDHVPRARYGEVHFASTCLPPCTLLLFPVISLTEDCISVRDSQNCSKTSVVLRSLDRCPLPPTSEDSFVVDPSEEAKLWRITWRCFPFGFRTAKWLHILSLKIFFFRYVERGFISVYVRTVCFSNSLLTFGYSHLTYQLLLSLGLGWFCIFA